MGLLQPSLQCTNIKAYTGHLRPPTSSETLDRSNARSQRPGEASQFIDLESLLSKARKIFPQNHGFQLGRRTPTQCPIYRFAAS
jgi:hypothetical protein